MKKVISVVGAVAFVLICMMLFVNMVPAKSEKKVNQKSKPIPENVVKVAEKSCVKCHTEPGNKMALSMVNISKWDKYSPEKQAAKAKAMCNMVTKDKMPPKSFRTENPGAVPTAEDIKIICDWAESIQLPKK